MFGSRLDPFVWRVALSVVVAWKDCVAPAKRSMLEAHPHSAVMTGG